AGLAVAAGLGVHGGGGLIEAELLEAIDGVITGMGIGEDLGQEDRQGYPRRVDTISPDMVAESARPLDKGPREELEERQPVLIAKLVVQGIESLAWECGSSLSHGDLLGG